MSAVGANVHYHKRAFADVVRARCWGLHSKGTSGAETLRRNSGGCLCVCAPARAFCKRYAFCVCFLHVCVCLRSVRLVNYERIELVPKRTWLWLIGFFYGGLRLQDVEINKDTAT